MTRSSSRSPAPLLFSLLPLLLASCTGSMSSTEPDASSMVRDAFEAPDRDASPPGEPTTDAGKEDLGPEVVDAGSPLVDAATSRTPTFLALGTDTSSEPWMAVALRSNDGMSFESTPIGPVSRENASRMRVEWDGERFLAALSAPEGIALYASPDGRAWTEVPSDLALSEVWGLIHGDGRWVLVAAPGYAAWTSDDGGTTWQERGPAGGVSRMVYVDRLGLFLSANWGGVIASSTDGETWEGQSFRSEAVPESPLHLFEVAVSEDELVVAGLLGFLARSTDGRSWTVVRDADPETDVRGFMAAMAYGGGRFVGSGVSVDGGRTFTAQMDPIFHPGLAAGEVGDQWRFVGRNPRLAWSDDGLEWNRVEDVEQSIADVVFAKVP